MKLPLAAWLVLGLVLGCYPCGTTLVPVTQDANHQVPEGFHYPESPETIRVETPLQSKSLRGTVTDPNGGSLERVLVESLGDGWNNRLNAVFTDSKGFFSLPKGSRKVHFLKLSKPGFNTLLIKVELRKKAKSQLQIKLGLSQ